MGTSTVPGAPTGPMIALPCTPTFMTRVSPCTAHSRAVWAKESWERTSPDVAASFLVVMFRVEAPLRISMPGHSTSGAEGVGEEGCAVPGFAPAKKLATFAVQVGELSSVEDE